MEEAGARDQGNSEQRDRTVIIAYQIAETKFERS